MSRSNADATYRQHNRLALRVILCLAVVFSGVYFSARLFLRGSDSIWVEVWGVIALIAFLAGLLYAWMVHRLRQLDDSDDDRRQIRARSRENAYDAAHRVPASYLRRDGPRTLRPDDLGLSRQRWLVFRIIVSEYTDWWVRREGKNGIRYHFARMGITFSAEEYGDLLKRLEQVGAVEKIGVTHRIKESERWQFTNGTG